MIEPPLQEVAAKTTIIAVLALLLLSSLVIAVPAHAAVPFVVDYSCPVGTNPPGGCDDLIITANWTGPYVLMNGTHPFIYLDNGTYWNATTVWNYTGWAAAGTAGTGSAADFMGLNLVNLSAPPTGASVFNNTENASSLGDPGLGIYSQNISMYISQFGKTIHGGMYNLSTPIVNNGYGAGGQATGTDSWGKLQYNKTYSVWTGIVNYIGRQSGLWYRAFANWSANSLQIQFRYAPHLSLSGNNTIANNTPAIFRTTPTLGAKPYHFHWFVNGTEIANTSQNASITFNSTGPKFVRAELYDSGLGWANATMEVNVTPTTAYPPSVLVASSRMSLDVEQSANLSMVATGGVPPYSYHWLLNGTPINEPRTFTFVPRGAGVYQYNATATGANGLTGWQDISETVYPALQTNITASGQNVLVGTPVTITDNVHGGLSPDSYTWYLNGSALTGLTLGNVTYTPKGSGVYNFTSQVSDANGEKSTATYLLHVNAIYVPPTVSITASRTASDLGQPVYLNATVTGGQYPLTYLWTATNGSLSNTNQPDVIFNASTWGPASVSLTVTDQRGNTTSEKKTLYVSSDPTLTSSVTPSKAIIYSPINGTMSVVGGKAPLSLEWILNGTTQFSTAPNFTYVPSAQGKYEFQAMATDSNGIQVLGSAFYVTVYPPGTYLPPVVSAISSTQSFDEGQSVTLRATVQYGEAPFTYAWHTGLLNNNGSTGPMLSTYGIDILQQQRFAWNVEVTDSHGETSWAFGNITGYPQTQGHVGTTIINNGTTAVLSIAASGGKSPYWLNLSVMTTNGIVQGDSHQETPYSYWINDTTGGKYSYSLMVKDANGQIVWANGTITIPGTPHTVPPGKTQLPSLFSGWELSILIGGIGGAALLLVLVAWRHRRPSHVSKQPEATEGFTAFSDDEDEPTISAPPDEKVEEWDERNDDSDVVSAASSGLPLSSSPMLSVTQKTPSPEVPQTTAPVSVKCKNCGSINIVEKVTEDTICPDCLVYYKKPNTPAWKGIPAKKRDTPKADIPKAPIPVASTDVAEKAEPPIELKPDEPKKDNEKGVPSLPDKPPIAVEDVRMIGKARSEDSPFTDLKPEDVNPNAQHIDPRLLQPMEIRVAQDRGVDVRPSSDGTTETEGQRKARVLMERAQRERQERMSRNAKAKAGVLQEKKPTEEK
jgi:hypothetical protein